MNAKALKKACEHIVERTGSCPYETLDVDLNCEEICHKGIDMWLCWCKYFKEREEEEE